MARTTSKAGVTKKVRQLKWPERGVVRRQDTEGQPEFRPPFPAHWAMNCRLQDPLEKRLRGGSRPGLAAWAGTVDGSVGPLLPAAELALAPAGCSHGCWYRDRLVAGGGLSNAVYLSRQGDSSDWDYGADVGDQGRAVVIQMGEAREIGDPATALLPFRDESLLAATEHSLWLLRGDPAADGSLRNLSRGVGILGPAAWCPIKDGRVGDTPVRYAFAFLSSLGLFMISPSGDGLQSLSEDRIPQELRDIPDTTTVSLAYSPDERGVYVFTTPATGVGTHWFFDLVHQGFWPLRLAEGHQPVAAEWIDGALVLQCQDGYLRAVGGTADQGQAIESYVLIGPVRLSGPDTAGILTKIKGILPPNSSSVGWRIIAGDTAAQVCVDGETAIAAYVAGETTVAESYAKAAGTWYAGRSLTRYPRVRGMWASILLKVTGPWAYESIVIESRDAGRWR